LSKWIAKVPCLMEKMNDDCSHSSHLYHTFNPRLDSRCVECQGKVGDVWRLSMFEVQSNKMIKADQTRAEYLFREKIIYASIFRHFPRKYRFILQRVAEEPLPLRTVNEWYFVLSSTKVRECYLSSAPQWFRAWYLRFSKSCLKTSACRSHQMRIQWFWAGITAAPALFINKYSI